MVANLCRALLMALVIAVSLSPAPAGDPFPFGTTLMLDAAPLRGSKRIPMLEIAEGGAVSIDLWCASARAQASVSDHSISISPGDLQSANATRSVNRAMPSFWRPWRKCQIGGARAKWSSSPAQHPCVFT
jgi:hypothetical protein